MFLRVVVPLLMALSSVARAETRVPVFLIVDEISIGEVEIAFDTPADLRLERRKLDEVLGPVLREDLWLRLERATRNERDIPARELERIGVKLSFDEARLELRAVVPLEIRRVRDVSLANRDAFGPRRGTDPFAGYMNLNVFAGVTDSDSPSLKGADPLRGQVEIVQHLGGVTFESVADYQEKENHPWSRGDTALVADFEPQQIRLRVGDSTPTSSGFLSALPGAGVHVFKQFNIDPSRPPTGTRVALLQIAKPSLAEISVNGVLLARLRLSPGPFNLRDVPLLTGRNRVHVKLIDDFGGEDEFDVDLFFDGELLGEGIHDFSYFSGKPWVFADRQRDYRDEAFTALSHRYGVNDRWTVGVAFENFRDQNLVNVGTGVLADPGTLQVDVAASRFAGQGGWADRWRFRSNDQDSGLLRRVRFLADYEHRSADFTTVALTPVPTDFSARAEGQVQTQWANRFVVGGGGGYQWGEHGNEDARLYRALFQMSFASNFRADLSLLKTQGDTVTTEQWLFTLTWFEPTGLAGANFTRDSLSGITSLNVRKNARRLNDDVSADLNLQDGPGGARGVDARADYRASKAELMWRHESRTAGSSRRHDTQIGLGTALAWAGDRVTLSRPIHDAFAILAAKELPADGELLINPGSFGTEARMRSWKTLVLPDLSSYQETSLRVDSTELPPGYLLEREFYRVRPGYRGGVFVDLGLSRRVAVTGRVTDAKDRSVKYAAGRIVEKGGRLVSEAFFTDQDGRFSLDPLLAGEYEVQLSETGWRPIGLTVPPDRTEFDAGALKALREEGL